MLRAGVLAAHKGAPPVLRDSAPGLPKKGPPWSIEGEPGGSKNAALKRPFEANYEGDAAGHTGHLRKPPSHIKTLSAPPASQITKYHSPQACTRHRNTALKPPAILHLEAHQEGAQLEENNTTCSHLHLATCHATITRTLLSASHHAHWPDSTQPLK